MNISKETTATAKTAVMGAIAGAIIASIVGFSWGGWVLASTAQKMADIKANESMVLALTPICVERFRNQADAGAQLDSMLKLSQFDQGKFVEKGGWAAAAGNEARLPAISTACAKELAKLTAADL